MSTKTIKKSITNSLKYQPETFHPNPNKCQSLKQRNDVIFKKGDDLYHFQVFKDQNIGFSILKTVPMNVDEDCQTTESVMQFGEKLCIKDLKAQIESSADSESFQN